jgi:hypothetical protein
LLIATRSIASRVIRASTARAASETDCTRRLYDDLVAARAIAG